ncbi:ribose-5-phosphate isomerase RpiA [Paenibacillus ginsengarvi]|uniref:Ribose-5-phosphate isomerase A n=1 Tax=Paenibacillus ginsengarvi TaxID=400777 RepID=A0A3B0C7Q8_9BACL|nr:ribose-5-phosphate isomerase RpiA [Paenibacillus ginsengarvi]RKN80449.1 ribose-5-phosphate isomerase RpiA [Paenibacillus ginsengarvi]
MESKRIAGEKALEYVQDGMTLGLGTGSTVYWTIVKLAERVKEGLRVRCVSTSNDTERLAASLGITLIGIDRIDELDLTIDGADEADPALNLIKGGGGALLREKMVASISKRLIIVADETKYVDELGKFPLPVEIVTFGWETTMRQLSKAYPCTPVLRMKDNVPFVTDNGHYIADCRFTAIPGPERIHSELNTIPGVVENGLFVHMADTLIIGRSDGRTEIRTRGR